MASSETIKRKLTTLLHTAGITVNGPEDFDPQVHDNRFYAKVLAQGSVGLGEAYMDGWYDIKAADQFFSRILRARLDEAVVTPGNLALYLQSVVSNMQNRSRSCQPATIHYDLPPALYMAFLDRYNQYSCCYFPNGNETLDEAAEKKLDLICRKLQLSPADHLLDIGCGWGGLARYAAEKTGCRVTGISISREQVAFARDFCRSLPVDIQQMDYRNLTGTFSKIVSVGMFEHVGCKNYREYLQIVHNCLSDQGIFLLHSIGRTETATHGDPWLHKYIFPNHMLPSVRQIGIASEGLLVMEDWHNFGAHYYNTLMAWYNKFVTNWGNIKKLDPSYDERFYRMWTYYLLCCAGAFHSRRHQLWQIVFTKRGIPEGYTSVR